MLRRRLQAYRERLVSSQHLPASVQGLLLVVFLVISLAVFAIVAIAAFGDAITRIAERREPAGNAESGDQPSEPAETIEPMDSEEPAETPHNEPAGQATIPS